MPCHAEARTHTRNAIICAIGASGPRVNGRYRLNGRLVLPFLFRDGLLHALDPMDECLATDQSPTPLKIASLLRNRANLQLKSGTGSAQERIRLLKAKLEWKGTEGID